LCADGVEHPCAISISTQIVVAEITREETHPVGTALERACLAAGFTPSVAFAANDYQEAQAMVAVDLGVSFAPRLALSNLRDDVRVISLTGAPSRRILLAHLSEQRLTPSAQTIAAIFTEVATTFKHGA